MAASFCCRPWKQIWLEFRPEQNSEVLHSSLGFQGDVATQRSLQLAVLAQAFSLQYAENENVRDVWNNGHSHCGGL